MTICYSHSTTEIAIYGSSRVVLLDLKVNCIEMQVESSLEFLTNLRL